MLISIWIKFEKFESFWITFLSYELHLGHVDSPFNHVWISFESYWTTLNQFCIVKSLQKLWNKKGLCHKASGAFFLCLSGCVWVISMKLEGVKEGSHRVPMDPQTIWNYCKKTRENSIFWLFEPKTALISGPIVPKMVQIWPQDLWEY